jgi:DNA-binding IclR family transcriptional regulator
MLSLNKASLLRIIRALEADKFLLRDGNTYRLGPRIMALSNRYLRTVAVHDVARPYMQALSIKCKKTVSLGILDDLEIVYIAIAKGYSGELDIQAHVGGRHPAHATALGKAILAHLDENEVSQRLEGADLTRLTHRTLISPKELKAQFARIRECGTAVDEEERAIGIRCVAAPIRRHGNEVVAALSVAGPIFDMTDDVFPTYQNWVRQTAEQISSDLGYEG